MKLVADKNSFKLKGKAFGEITVNTEFPQFDSLTELEQNAGGPEAFLAWANRIVKAQSLVPLRNLNVKMSAEDDTTTAESAQAKAIELRRKYSLASSRSGISKAEKANKFDDVMNLVGALDENASLDDIRAKLAEIRALQG